MSDQVPESKVEIKPDNRRMRVFLALIPLVIFAGLAGIFFKQLKSDTNPSELPSPLLGKAEPQFAMPALEGLVRDGKQLPGLKTRVLGRSPFFPGLRSASATVWLPRGFCLR